MNKNNTYTKNYTDFYLNAQLYKYSKKDAG